MAKSAIRSLALAVAMVAAALHGETETVRGLVTFGRGGYNWAFLLREDGVGVRLEFAPGSRARTGDEIEATGRVMVREPVLRINDVAVRKLGTRELPPRTTVTVAELYEPGRDHFAMPVTMTVRLDDVNRRRTQLQFYASDLDADNPKATVSIPLAENATYDKSLRRGAIVRIRAVPSMIYENLTSGCDWRTLPRSLTLNVERIEDVEILNPPSWWTPERAWTATGIGAFTIAMLAGWVALLLRARRAERANEKLLAADRRRIADDLHDNMQQLLAGAMFRLDAARSSVNDPIAAARQIAGARKAVEYSQAGLRSVLWGLQETRGSPDSLAGLLRYAASRMAHWEGVVSIESDGEEPVRLRRHGARLLMILQEAVGNALNHGKATKIDVRLAFGKSALAMTIADNGCGFGGKNAAGRNGLGMASMRRRAEEIGGTFSIESEPGKGTTVTVEIKEKRLPAA